METTAFQKVYKKLSDITKATVTLEATGVGNEEMAFVNDRPAQVVKIQGNRVTLQVFSGTEGIATDAHVIFTGKSPTLKVGPQLAGRYFNAYGQPIDGGPEIEGEEVEIGGTTGKSVRGEHPSALIATGIPRV